MVEPFEIQGLQASGTLNCNPKSTTTSSPAYERRNSTCVEVNCEVLEEIPPTVTWDEYLDGMEPSLSERERQTEKGEGEGRRSFNKGNKSNYEKCHLVFN